VALYCLLRFRVSDHGDKQIHRKVALPVEEPQLQLPDVQQHVEVLSEEPQLHEEQQLQLPDVQQHVEVLSEEPQLHEEPQLQLPDVQQQLQLLQQLQNLGVLQQLLNGGMLQQLQQQQNGGPAHLVMLAPLSHSNDQEEEENRNLTDFESKFWYPKFLLYFLFF